MAIADMRTSRSAGRARAARPPHSQAARAGALPAGVIWQRRPPPVFRPPPARDLLARRAAQRKGDPLGFTDIIMEFHIPLAEVSRNRVLSTLLRGFVPLLISTYGPNTTPERATRVLRNYGALVDAIAEHDSDKARTIMRAHLRHARDALAAQDRLGEPPRPGG